jgi:hypothetical protein
LSNQQKPSPKPVQPPSSKCNQISLTLGELYNDIIIICGQPKPDMDKLLRKQLAAYALRFDNMVAMSEKDCYDRGYDDALRLGAKKTDEQASKVEAALSKVLPTNIEKDLVDS